MRKPGPDGDQRFIFIQTVTNNKRRKRAGKKTHKCTLPTRERVMHVLVTGKIKDYTHPKEIDPFWDILYRQYEYLVYSEMYLRSTIKESCCEDIGINSGCLDVIITTLEAIERQKAALVTYMANFMFLMYGSVMKSRFYGWMHYSQKFTSKFNEVTIQLLNRLKFDANKTRCSVYYYQAFWLCGLSIIGEIRKQLTTTCNLEVDMDRGTLSIPVNSRQDYKKKVKDIRTNSEAVVHNRLKKLEEIQRLEKETGEQVVTDEEKSPEDILIENEGEEGRQVRLKSILSKILQQIDISTDALYTSTERSLLKIGRFIKQKLKKGTLDISEDDLLFLKEQYLSDKL